MTYVCITGNEQSTSALTQRLERVLGAHPRVLCELRLDYLDLHPPGAFGFLARLPADWAPRLILTQRLKASGPLANGACAWDVLTWQSWWKDVMALRPWFAVDLDWLVLDQLAGESLAWRGKFRSRHAFFSLHAPLAEIERQIPELISSAKEHNAGVKIAAPVEGIRDLHRLAELKERLSELPLQIAVAMGPAGRVWRWSRLSGEISYFAAERSLSTAPGQDTLADVLPYLSTRERPDLYVLLGDNPENRYGEEQWNRAFLRRGSQARYLNLPCKEAAGSEWAKQAFAFLEAADIQGASVTKPFKLSFSSPTNTLKKEEHWIRENTDGGAVAEILSKRGVAPGSQVVVAGGGGAAKCVEEGLLKRGYEVNLWIRESGKLGECPPGKIFISTWPGEYQESLIESLPERNFSLVIDAQLSRSPAPLKEWCQEKNFDYISGAYWWKLQANLQDRIWFGPERLGLAREKVLQFVPASKSETIRALAISFAFALPTEIHGPSICDDTETFVEALEKFGASVDRNGAVWRVFPPEILIPPKQAISMGEGATGFRILASLSSVMAGEKLVLEASDSLRMRPQEELRLAFQANDSWPLEIPTGRNIPAEVATNRSSQFATGFLIAGAARVFRGLMPEFRLQLGSDRISESYIEMTLSMIELTGLRVERGDEIRIFPGEKKTKVRFEIEKDASSLAFLEVFAKRWGLATFFDGDLKQGDGAFPQILQGFLEGNEISLRHHPDLAPPLWSAAIMFRRKIVVKNCPQLRLKESDRAKLLVEAAEKLGAKAELLEDGFVIDASKIKIPREELYLRTDGDHRMAMAFGLLTQEDSLILPDRKDCVKKSFPGFWQALQLLAEALPG